MLKCPRGQAPGAPEALYSVRIITHCSKRTDLLLTCLYLLSLHWSVTTFTLLKGTLKFRELSGLRPRTRARPEPGTRCAGSQPSAWPASGQPLGSGPTPLCFVDVFFPPGQTGSRVYDRRSGGWGRECGAGSPSLTSSGFWLPVAKRQLFPLGSTCRKQTRCAPRPQSRAGGRFLRPPLFCLI